MAVHLLHTAWRATRLVVVTLFFLLLAASCTTTAPLWRLFAPPRQPRLLLYIPLHVSEPASHLRDMADCLLSRQPSLAGLRYDVLVSLVGPVVSGGREHELKDILGNATSAPATVIFTRIRDDAYAKTVANDKRKGTQWVSGPNAAFFNAFLDGSIHANHIRHYDLVQQLETDVCAMRDGWLDALVEPALRNPSILISGAATSCDCVYDAIHDTCEPMHKHGEHVERHVNGNALYRIGGSLRQVLRKARAEYGSTEPFDLAYYWALEAMGWLPRLHANPHYLNTPCLVDRTRFTIPSYHGTPAAVAVHTPRRVRTTNVQAVASRGLNAATQSTRKLHTLTVVVVTRFDERLFVAQRDALAAQFVEGVVYVVPDRATFDAVSRLAPRLVVGAFAPESAQVADAADTISKQLSKHQRPDARLEMWPASHTLAGSLMTAVARFVELGHDVFVMGLDAMPVTNYMGTLAELDRERVWVAEGGMLLASDTSVGLAYLPSTHAAAVDAWASALRDGHSVETQQTLAALVQALHGRVLKIAPLPWSKFVVHGPLLSSGWPANTVHSREVVAVGGLDEPGATLYRLRAARAWPRDDRTSCANFTMIASGPINLTSSNAARVIDAHADFAAFVQANAIDCAVVPGFALPSTRSRIDVSVVLEKFAIALGSGTTLLPSRVWIHPGAQYIKFTWHRRVNVPSLALATPLDTAVRSAIANLHPGFVCVRDPTRGADEVALLNLQSDTSLVGSGMDALKRQHGIASHILLTGAWKTVRARDVLSSSAAASVSTLADIGGGNPFSLATPTLATTPPNVLRDPAWADVIENVLCTRHAAAAVDATSVFRAAVKPSAVVDAIVPYIPPNMLRRDLTALQTWRRRTDKAQLTRPPVVAVSDNGVSHSITTLTTLHTIADVQAGRGIVLPIADDWTADAYESPNILPPVVLAFTLPRVALATHASWLLPSPSQRSVDIAGQHKAEITLLKRWAKRWTHAVVWTARGNLTVDAGLEQVRAVPARDGILFFV